MDSGIEHIKNAFKYDKNSFYSKIPIILILLLALFLYIYQIGYEPLWMDEIFSIEAITATLSERPERAFSPVYITLLGLWSKFGDSSAWLRSLSALFGLGSIFVLYQLGRQTIGKSGGLIAALLLTLSPTFIYHSQEVRYYTLGVFLNLSGTLVLLLALESPKPKLIGSWTILRLLAIFTQTLHLFILLPDAILFGFKFYKQRRHFLAFSSGLLFICAAVFPHILRIQSLATKYGGELYDAQPGPGFVLIAVELTHQTVYWPLKHLFGISQVDPLIYLEEIRQKTLFGFFIDNFNQLNIFWLIVYATTSMVLIALLIISLFGIQKQKKLLWVAVWALVPAITFLAYSHLMYSIWRERYILVFSPYVFILLSAGFGKICQWRHKVAMFVAALYLLAVGNGLVHYYTTVYRAFNGHSS